MYEILNWDLWVHVSKFETVMNSRRLFMNLRKQICNLTKLFRFIFNSESFAAMGWKWGSLSVTGGKFVFHVLHFTPPNSNLLPSNLFGLLLSCLVSCLSWYILRFFHLVPPPFSPILPTFSLLPFPPIYNLPPPCSLLPRPSSFLPTPSSLLRPPASLLTSPSSFRPFSASPSSLLPP